MHIDRSMVSRAEYMRGYRKTHPKKIQAIEKRRNGTLRRREWRNSYDESPKRSSYLHSSRVKERINKAVKALHRKRKLELMTFMGGRCLMCGLRPENVEGCLSVFVIDEIIPLGVGKSKFTNLNKERLEQAKLWYSEQKVQLLCQNCSAIKSWKNNDYSNKKQHHNGEI